MFATGVTIVSGMEDGEPVGFTCQSFVSLSIDPPDGGRGPGPDVDQLAPDRPVGQLLRQRPGRGPGGAVPRVRRVGRRRSSPASTGTRRPGTGSPVIDGSLAWVDCRVELVHDAGDHELILGRVIDLGVGRRVTRSSSSAVASPRSTTTGRPSTRGRHHAEDHRVRRHPDVIVVEPDAHGDERGRFVETYRRSWFPLGREMIQGNRSTKQAGAIVGLHYHLHQSDYWYVLAGTARVVLHDLRQGSPTDGATALPRPRRATTTGACSSRRGWPTASPR